MAKIVQPEEVPKALVQGKTLAIIGYGNQGRAHALNLRDNGCRVVVGARDGGQGRIRAEGDGFSPLSIPEAAEAADLVMMTLPDEAMSDIYHKEVARWISRGKTLMVCHGFSFHFGHIAPPPGVDVCLAAPKGSGATLRMAFENGKSLAGLFAVLQDASGQARRTALSYLWGIGCAGSLILETTFEEECVTDLFGEQVVLCGGIPELIKAAYETLVQAGYSPESAYLECLHEAKLITDLIYERGLSGMREAISDTAEWGGYTIGTRLIDDAVRQKMKDVLNEIQSGSFAEQWVDEARRGKERLLSAREKDRSSPIESVGARLRKDLL